MDDYLTTKQLQEVLKIDRTTIYRMLSDGRLQGIRLGGQWRFPRNIVDECIVNPKALKQAVEADEIKPTADVLPLNCLAPIQDVFASAADVGAVTTTLDGKPITPFNNSCEYCNLILASAEGHRRCEESWRQLAQPTEHAPRIERCHAGLSYARGRIQVENEFVAMIFAGQFVNDETARRALPIKDLAHECAIPLTDLQRAASQIRLVESARADWLLRLLQKVADTFSEIGGQRLDLLQRLRQVARLAQV
jgi:excisionase family DNA binding protein